MSGLVSVIIPVYNAEGYVKFAIDSVLGQTYKNIEIILIDDCSRDNSLEIIKQYEEKHSNIYVEQMQQNGGVAKARNRGMELAKGKYVAFLDSDDVWEAEKLERQIEKLTTMDDACLSYTGIEFIDQNSNHIKYVKVPEKMTYSNLLRNTAIATSSVVVNIEKTGKFEMPDRKTGEDYVTWLRLLHSFGNAYGVQEPLMKYRKLANSLSSNRLSSISDFWYAQHTVFKKNFFQVFFNYSCFCLRALKKHFF